MMSDSFAEQRACGFLVSGVENQRPEIIERAKIGRRPPKQFEIVALGFFEQALFAEETGAFKAGFQPIGILLYGTIESLHPRGNRARPRICNDLAHIDPGSGESVGGILEQNLP